MKRFRVFLSAVLAVAVMATSVILGACSGGGGGAASPPASPTVSGVAAAGAPIIGFAYLKDSATPAVTRGPVTIANNGSFSFDVAGLTPPFILKVEGSVGGQSVKLISVATGAGTANVNPITNIAVAAATQENDPSVVYDAPSGYVADLTQANLNTAVGQIQTMLQSLLTAYNTTTDPLTGNYSANHTGLDAVLDVVTIGLDTSTGGVTVDSKTTGAPIGGANIGGTGLTSVVPVPVADVPAPQTITDLQAIGNTLQSIMTMANSKGMSLAPADLDPYYAIDSTFGMNDGFNRADTITLYVGQMSEAASTMSFSGVTGLALVSVDAGVYKVSGNMKFSDGSLVPLEDFASLFVKEGGTWKIKGNGHIATTWVFPRAVSSAASNGFVNTTTGIGVEIQDDGNQGIKSAVVTGPGMSGILYVESQFDPGRLCFNNGMYCDVTYDQMSDTTIGAIPDNAVYTVAYYLSTDGTGTVLETRNFTVSKRPYKSTELTNGSFLATNVTSHALSAIISSYGGTFNFTYSLPTEYVAVQLGSELAFYEFASQGGSQVKINKNLLLTQRAASITTAAAAWTPLEAYFYTHAVDQYGRWFHTYWGFK
jgi:hypothetical protein